MKKVYLFLLSFLPSYSFSQFIAPLEKDSIPSIIEIYYQDDFLQPLNSSFLDTNISGVINTHPIFYNFQLNLGNLGTPQYSVEFKKLSQNIGFVGNFDQLSFLRFAPSLSPIYKVNKAYTEFSYLNGTQEEERFSVIHVQPLKNQKNIGFKYQSSNSLGFYNRQRSQFRNFHFFGNYESLNSKYYLDGAFFFNRSNIQENGGIANDTLFNNNALTRSLIPVFLENASNKSEQREYYINHSYAFISENKDSIGEGRKEIKVFQSFNFYQLNNLFSDLATDSAYYSGTDVVKNSELWSKWNYQKIDNKIGVLFRLNDFDFVAHLQQQFIEVGTYKERRFLQNQIVGLNGNLEFFKVIDFTGYYEQVIGGYNSGDGKLHLIGDIPIFKYWNAIFKYQTLVARVPFVFNTFYSNQLEIQNNFQKEKLNQLSGAIAFKNILLFEAGTGLFNNGVYFDSPFSATQSNTNDEFFYLEANFNANLKRITWQSKLKYQTFANGNLFPLPNLVSFNRFFVKGWIFDHHMEFNLGFDLFYTSKYRGYGYSPLTRQFFLNSSGSNLGNYPFIDLFAAAKVKSARFFVKLSHLNQGLTGNNFMLAKNYPQHDFSLRLGFSWAFLN